MKGRIRNMELYDRIVTAEQAADRIVGGMTVAMSGYAMAGYPKAVVEAMVKRKKADDKFTVNLITGANVPFLDEVLGTEGIISRRTPMCASKILASQINKGDVRYVEQQMSKMPRLLRSGSFGKIDIAVVEAVCITQHGLVPTTSVGLTHYLMNAAEEIIVEINMAQPEKLLGIHDIYIPDSYPNVRPIPLLNTVQRIGDMYIPLDTKKIKHIVITNIPERTRGKAAQSTIESIKITENLFAFLKQEYKTDTGALLPPIQLGFGNIADTIANSFAESSFNDLQFFCGGVSEPVLNLLAIGKASAISAGGLEMSDRVEQLINDIPNIREKLVLRNGDITNRAEIIERLGVLSLNTGIEADIYGNVNASHIAGSIVVNGIGGGANFAQNAGLSVILIPSTGRAGTISNIVPMVSHQDICEHDVDILITEHGVADLRGLDDMERADAIISCCTAGAYREQLFEYLALAKRSVGGHHPQLPEEAFAWYRRLKEKGTMQEVFDGKD